MILKIFSKILSLKPPFKSLKYNYRSRLCRYKSAICSLSELGVVSDDTKAELILYKKSFYDLCT